MKRLLMAVLVIFLSVAFSVNAQKMSGANGESEYQPYIDKEIKYITPKVPKLNVREGLPKGKVIGELLREEEAEILSENEYGYEISKGWVTKDKKYVLVTVDTIQAPNPEPPPPEPEPELSYWGQIWQDSKYMIIVVVLAAILIPILFYLALRRGKEPEIIRRKPEKEKEGGTLEP